MKHYIPLLLLSLFIFTTCRVQRIEDPRCVAEAFFASGVKEYEKGKFRRAITEFNKGKQWYKQAHDDLTFLPYYDMWISSCYYKLGNEKQASKIYPHSYQVPPVDMRLTAAADSLSLIGKRYYAEGDYPTALSYFEKCREAGRAVLGNEHYFYANASSLIADCYAHMKDYSRAIELFDHCLAIYESTFGNVHPRIAQMLIQQADCYSKLQMHAKAMERGARAVEILDSTVGENDEPTFIALTYLAGMYLDNQLYKQAVQTAERAITIQKKTGGDNHPDLVIPLLNLGSYYSKSGMHRESIEVTKEALAIEKSLRGDSTLIVADCLSNLANGYTHLAQYDTAIILSNTSLEIRKELLGEIDPDVAVSLDNLGRCYFDKGDYNSAMELAAQALDIRLDFWQSAPELTAISFNNIAAIYFSMGEFREAIKLGKQALEIRKAAFGEYHPLVAGTLNNLAAFYSGLGKYEVAVELQSQALEIRKKLFNSPHPNIANSLNDLGASYSIWGDYYKAIELMEQACEMYSYSYGNSSPSVAICLHNLSSYYHAIGKCDTAIVLANRALDIYKGGIEANPHKMAIMSGNLGTYYSSLGQYDEALKYIQQELEMKKASLGENHPDVAITLNNLSTVYYRMNNNDEAFKLITKALEIQEKTLGNQHPDVALSFDNLSFYYNYKRDFSEAGKCLYKSLQIYKKAVLSNFHTQTAKERELFWNTMNNSFRNASAVYLNSPADSLLSVNAYNIALFTKGLLLNSEISIKELLRKYGSQQQKERFSELEQIRFMLAKNPLYRDSLQQQAEAIERSLVKESEVYGDYTDNLLISWEEVQAALGENDLAIEFTDFRLSGKEIYAALILKKGWSHPRIVSLFNKSDLDALRSGDTVQDINSLYTNPIVGEKIWAPLEKYMEKSGNIYFSPSGRLHQVAIEYLPYKQEGRINEQYNLHRLSSTRELCRPESTFCADTLKAVMYGWLDYETSPDTIQSQMKKIEEKEEKRRHWRHLYHTRKEIREVKKILEENHVRVDLYEDQEGTEETFITHSGKGVNILHMATHGFFEPGENDRFISLEEQAFQRSGLVMAGANAIFKDKEKYSFRDDGLLTSKEIASMDFRDLNLVVLSACQTGLGEITGEGVFGLQRAFKKAGAGTLLMSLWEVHDVATQVMMTEFYKAIFAGYSNGEALAIAQKEVKKGTYKVNNIPYPGTDPYFWAAFILLD